MAQPSLELSRRERLEAWLLTGPPGRVWSFGRDVVSAMPMLARYWGGRARKRLEGEGRRDES
jgi:hypothetical protein